MTPQEVIKTLEVAKAEVEWNYPMEYAVAIDEAIKAVEKQIPKKPYEVDWGEVFEGALLEDRCAICSCHVFTTDNYCLNCGQAIDWEVEE